MAVRTSNNDDLAFDPSTAKVSSSQMPAMVRLLSYSLVSQVTSYTPNPAHTLKRPGLGYGLGELLTHTLLLNLCHSIRHCVCNQTKKRRGGYLDRVARVVGVQRRKVRAVGMVTRLRSWTRS